MPNIGDFARDKDIGLVDASSKHIWYACVDCGKERWVRFLKGQPQSLRCRRCAGKLLAESRKGEGSPNWKGGRLKSGGYIKIRVYEDDFFYPMTNNIRYVCEHRLVMAKHLGRCLQPWEHIHHKNGIKDDNRLENLELTTNSFHHKEHNQGYQDGYLRGYLDGKDQRVQDLMKENKELKQEIERLGVENGFALVANDKLAD